MLVPSVPGRWVIISDRLPDLKGKGYVTGLVYDGFQNELPTASSFRRELWLTAGPQGSQDASWERFMENKTHTMTWTTFGLSSDKVFTIYSASYHHPQVPAFCILSIILSSTTVDKGVQTPYEILISFSLSAYSEEGWLGHMAVLFRISLGNSL